MDATTFEVKLRLARAGDREAGGKLLASFERALTGQAQRLIRAHLRPKLGPEDVVQETLLLAWERLDQFRGRTPEELAGWLRRILASQLARVFCRYQGTQGRNLQRERPLFAAGPPYSRPGAFDLAASWTSPSQHAVRAETVARVESALTTLPHHYRLVLDGYERQGLTFAQIARQLGRSEPAVRKLWSRALLALHRAVAS